MKRIGMCFTVLAAVAFTSAAEEFTAAVDEVDEALKLAEQYVGKDYTMTLMPTGSLTVPLYKG